MLRSGHPCDPPQPGPYYAIDAGISGRPDPAQLAWLSKVSYEDDRPKALFTSKLIYVNGVREEDFRCYPLSRDSLARFSQ